MARRLSYLQLKDRAEKAERREDFKRQARIANPKPYQRAPRRYPGFYKSYLKEDQIFELDVIGANLLCLGTGTPADTVPVAEDFTKAGLLATLPGGESAVKIKGTGAKPAKLQWYKGLETPISGRTPWDTPSRKWGDKTGGANGQSHRSCPVGDLTDPVTFAGITSLVALLLTPLLRTQLLGASGQIMLLPEEGNISL